MGHAGDEGASKADGRDSGLIALTTLLAFHSIAAESDQLRHELGHMDALASEDILRLAKRIPAVRAKAITADASSLPRIPLPAIAAGRDGSWFIIGKADATGVLIQRPGSGVDRLTLDDLGELWAGGLILIASREAMGGALARFDVRWFIPQIVKYRRLIGEVLLITFALNLLGLAAPLFFQNVIDKVLVHNTMATLQRAGVRVHRCIRVGDCVRMAAHTAVFGDQPED